MKGKFSSMCVFEWGNQMCLGETLSPVQGVLSRHFCSERIPLERRFFEGALFVVANRCRQPITARRRLLTPTNRGTRRRDDK